MQEIVFVDSQEGLLSSRGGGGGGGGPDILAPGLQSQKNGLRAHLAQGYSFNEALSQTLLHYRAAQHATTGLPLHRLCPPTSHGGNPVVKARVCEQQLKARSRFDAKKKARIPRISGLGAGSAATPEK